MAAVFVILLAFLNQLREFGTSVLTAYAGEQMLRGFRTKLFRHVQRLSLSYHDSRGTADSIYRIQQDAQATQSLLVDGAMPCLSAAITLSTMIAVTARLHGHLALVALCICPPLAFQSRAYRPAVRTSGGAVQRAQPAACRPPRARAGRRRLARRLVRLRRPSYGPGRHLVRRVAARAPGDRRSDGGRQDNVSQSADALFRPDRRR